MSQVILIICGIIGLGASHLFAACFGINVNSRDNETAKVALVLTLGLWAFSVWLIIIAAHSLGGAA